MVVIWMLLDLHNQQFYKAISNFLGYWWDCSGETIGIFQSNNMILSQSLDYITNDMVFEYDCKLAIF